MESGNGHRPPITSFFTWLQDQKTRQDEIGHFANTAIKDKTFPRTRRHLHFFLHYYALEPENYKLVKYAHAEWRQLRAQSKMAQENPGNQL